jgi:hypothetical protein
MHLPVEVEGVEDRPRGCLSLSGDCGGLFVLSGCGQRPRDVCQGLRLPLRVGDRPGNCNSLFVLPGYGQ